MLLDQAREALQYVQAQADQRPRIGVILGSGLGHLADEVKQAVSIPYRDIPHFPRSTVHGHKGELMLGMLFDIPAVVMSGRFHYYEGYDMQTVTFPVRLMKLLGIELLVVSNAAGSVQAQLLVGDLVFIRDHILHMPANPLRGPNEDRFGPRFPDMMRVYDNKLCRRAFDIAREEHIRAHTGVYMGLAGPNLETPAEYEMAHRMGADLVGMSTVPEAIVAAQMSLSVFAVSVVTDRAYPLGDIQPTTHEEVVRVANEAAPRLSRILRRLLIEWSSRE